jgi:protease-4
MSFDSDALIDRRRLKRRLGLWRLAAIIATAGLVVGVVLRTDTPLRGEHIARIDVNGVIVEDREREQALAKVAKNRRTRALIVRINSPGGTVVGSEILFQRLRAIAKVKPVVAVMGSLAASGGYMTALGADHILAQPGTVTGSIGVVFQTTDVTELLKKIGIKAEAVKSSPLKAVPSPLEKLTERGRRATRAVVMDMYNMFVDMVVERRGMSRNDALKLADGRVFTGRQALANRLVDGIGDESEARDWLTKEHGIGRKLPIVEVKIERDRPDVLDLIKGVMGKTVFSERLTLDGLVSLWQPEFQ